MFIAVVWIFNVWIFNSWFNYCWLKKRRTDEYELIIQINPADEFASMSVYTCWYLLIGSSKIRMNHFLGAKCAKVADSVWLCTISSVEKKPPHWRVRVRVPVPHWPVVDDYVDYSCQFTWSTPCASKNAIVLSKRPPTEFNQLSVRPLCFSL